MRSEYIPSDCVHDRPVFLGRTEYDGSVLSAHSGWTCDTPNRKPRTNSTGPIDLLIVIVLFYW